MYSSNTAHYLRERIQRCLLASQGTSACWAIHRSINKIQYSLPYSKASYFSLSNHGSYESPVFIIPYKTLFTAFFVQRLGRKGIRCLFVFLWICTASLLAVREQFMILRVCENGALGKILRPEGEEVAGGRRKLYSERPHNMYFSTIFILCFFYVGISEYVCSTDSRMTGEWWIVRTLEGSDCSLLKALTKNVCWQWGIRRKSLGSK